MGGYSTLSGGWPVKTKSIVCGHPFQKLPSPKGNNSKTHCQKDAGTITRRTANQNSKTHCKKNCSPAWHIQGQTLVQGDEGLSSTILSFNKIYNPKVPQYDKSVSKLKRVWCCGTGNATATRHGRTLPTLPLSRPISRALSLSLSLSIPLSISLSSNSKEAGG